eukprot:Skav218497  [mRNA]  locus=scaffold3758:12085:13722:- [translate_table: standard]
MRAGHGSVGSQQILTTLQLIGWTLTTQHLKEGLWLVEDLHIHQPQLLIHRGHTEAEHLQQLALAPISLVAACELAPVAPSESHCWRSGKNFQQLPRKGSESIVKFLMRLFPRNARRVIELCRATT